MSNTSEGRHTQEHGAEPIVLDTERFSFQLRMLERGADELQRHIGRMDEILFKIKASAVTVWTALIGWSFTTKNTALISLGFMVVLGFWLLEGFFRGLQARYLTASSGLTNFLNDKKALNQSFKTRIFPGNLVYPMTFQEGEMQNLRLYVKGLVAPSTGILYVFLAFVNYLIWIATNIQ
jgi:hypothetical protein